jgi:hypothetical protein
MKKKSNLTGSKDSEICSANENIYDMFSITELEQRLQMSEAGVWCDTKCGTDCNPICNTNDQTCTTDQLCTSIVCTTICGAII